MSHRQTDTLAALSAGTLISFPQLFWNSFIFLCLDPWCGLVIQFVEVVPMLKVLHIYAESAYYLDQFYAGSAGDFKHWTWDLRTGTHRPRT